MLSKSQFSWRERFGYQLLAIMMAAPVMAADEPLGTSVKNNLINTAQKIGLTANGNNDGRSVLDLFGVYLKISLGFVGIVFTVQVVHGGYLWMTASGNEEKVKKAQSKIANGAIGAGVIFLAYIITSFLLGQFTEISGVLF